MDIIGTILWYIKNTLWYVGQMLPCMTVSAVIFLVSRSARMRWLEDKGLFSSFRRECALLIFVMFGAGLASLTLFPSEFWREIWSGRSLASFYPTWEEITARVDCHNLFTPFQEIRRILYGGPWIFFIFLGNIGMFLPIGLFTGLLWRNPKWWKSMLIGAVASTTIEFIQLFIGRSTDIDDVILNTTGTLAGYWIFCVIRALFPGFTSKFQCQADGRHT